MPRILLAILLVFATLSSVIAETLPGKKSPAGKPSPAIADDATEAAAPTNFYNITRNPFRPPTEILPSECPPSMPLCRFDYAQLKVVGLFQNTENNYKALVEDPDGRGYTISPGQMVGSATVTQISREGIFLKIHKTKKDVVLPIFHQEGE